MTLHIVILCDKGFEGLGNSQAFFVRRGRVKLTELARRPNRGRQGVRHRAGQICGR